MGGGASSQKNGGPNAVHDEAKAGDGEEGKADSTRQQRRGEADRDGGRQIDERGPTVQTQEAKVGEDGGGRRCGDRIDNPAQSDRGRCDEDHGAEAGTRPTEPRVMEDFGGDAAYADQCRSGADVANAAAAADDDDAGDYDDDDDVDGASHPIDAEEDGTEREEDDAELDEDDGEGADGERRYILCHQCGGVACIILHGETAIDESLDFDCPRCGGNFVEVRDQPPAEDDEFLQDSDFHGEQQLNQLLAATARRSGTGGGDPGGGDASDDLDESGEGAAPGAPEELPASVQSAAAFGISQEELLFNLMMFGDAQAQNLNDLYRNAVDEAVAAHSENNTPYKLKPVSEDTVAALKAKAVILTDDLLTEIAEAGRAYMASPRAEISPSELASIRRKLFEQQKEQLMARAKARTRAQSSSQDGKCNTTGEDLVSQEGDMLHVGKDAEDADNSDRLPPNTVPTEHKDADADGDVHDDESTCDDDRANTEAALLDRQNCEPGEDPDDDGTEMDAADAVRGSADEEEDPSKQAEVPSCIVCRENLCAGESGLELACRHVFHMECMLRWLSLQSTCPVCRAEIQPPGAAGSTKTEQPEDDDRLLANKSDDVSSRESNDDLTTAAVPTDPMALQPVGHGGFTDADADDDDALTNDTA